MKGTCPRRGLNRIARANPLERRVSRRLIQTDKATSSLHDRCWRLGSQGASWINPRDLVIPQFRDNVVFHRVVPAYLRVEGASHPRIAARPTSRKRVDAVGVVALAVAGRLALVHRAFRISHRWTSEVRRTPVTVRPIEHLQVPDPHIVVVPLAIKGGARLAEMVARPSCGDVDEAKVHVGGRRVSSNDILLEKVVAVRSSSIGLCEVGRLHRRRGRHQSCC
jgi:hypothetical protein